MILTSGVFDGLHAGHVAYLKAASRHRAEGEGLTVAVASDGYVKHAKGRWPTWTADQRASVVFALDMVTAATIHDDAGAANSIRELKPRLFLKGADWKDRLPEDVLAACFEVGCAIVFVDSGVTQHSSDSLVSPV